MWEEEKAAKRCFETLRTKECVDVVCSVLNNKRKRDENVLIITVGIWFWMGN